MLLNRNYRSILCLNGELPQASFFHAHDLPLFAADGAANRLNELGISPDMVIGDLDSIHESIRNQHAIQYEPCQNSSDFQKSIRFLTKQALLPALIVGMNGGYLDHILNNINIFMETNSLFYAPPIQGFTMSNQQTDYLTLPLNSKLSIFGMPSACVTSKGLQWELNTFELNFPGQTSCFNRSIEATVELTVNTGAILIMIYEQTNRSK